MNNNKVVSVSLNKKVLESIDKVIGVLNEAPGRAVNRSMFIQYACVEFIKAIKDAEEEKE